jgi:hypothetical protein
MPVNPDDIEVNLHGAEEEAAPTEEAPPESSAEPAVEEEPAATDEPAADAPEPEAPAAETEEAEESEPTEIKDLPPWAQKLIQDTRAEAAKTRTEAKKHAAEEAAKTAKAELANDIGRALGLIPDGAEGEEAEKPPTPEELVKQLADQRGETQSAKMELAIYRAAGAHNADPAALLDSRGFLAAVKNLDPNDTDSLGEAIRGAVEGNARLRVTAPAAEPKPSVPSGGQFAGGPSGRGQDDSTKSIDDFRKDYAANRPR